MKNRVIWLCNLFPIILLISVLILQLEAFAQRSDPAMGTAEFAKGRITKLQQTARTLRELAAQPLPAQLSDKEKREAERHTKWLKDSSQKLDELASRWHSRLTDDREKSKPAFPTKRADGNESVFQHAVPCVTREYAK